MVSQGLIDFVIAVIVIVLVSLVIGFVFDFGAGVQP